MKNFICLIFAFISFSVFANTEVIGHSEEGREITVTQFGPKSGTALILMGGIHGLYESNSVELMQEFINYFSQNTPHITLYILENMNPDSFFTDADLDYQWYDPDGYDNSGNKIGSAWSRFNANGVDLNRNWNTASWKSDVTYAMLREGAGGEYPMSEIETRVVANFLIEKNSEYENLLVINYHCYAFSGYDHGMSQPSYTGDWRNPNVNNMANEYALIYSSVNPNAQYLRAWTQYEVPGEFLNWAGNNNISAVDIEIANNNPVHEINTWGKTHYEQHLASVLAVIDSM